MADVQFEEPSNSYYTPVQSSSGGRETKLVRLAIKFGLAKDSASANGLFAFTAVFCVLASVVMYLYFVMGYNPFASKSTVPVRNSNVDTTRGPVRRPGAPTQMPSQLK